jgi:hypothetical protein
MLYDHITFPGAVENVVPEFLNIIENLQVKSNLSSGKGKNVDVKWYGGGYISDIEDAIYYYFQKANNNNFGYSINSIDAIRLESYSKDGSFSERMELNHWVQNYYDRKLVAIINLNPPFDPDIAGGKIKLIAPNGSQSEIDKIFYQKTGAIVVFNSFQKYIIDTVSVPQLKYLFAFCIGSKWQ